MKSSLMKMLLAFGVAASIGAVSSQAVACGRTYYSHHMGSTCCSCSFYQGRPVKCVHGSLVYVRHCSCGYWHHHKWHKGHCSV